MRSALCTSLACLPLVVGIPTHADVASIAYFCPLVFGVLGAVTLQEHTHWLRPRNRALWLCRGGSTVLSDLACSVPFVLTIATQPERMGILAGALLAMAAGMAVAVVAQECAWLASALIGFACLLAGDQPLVAVVPLPAALLAYFLCLTVLSVRGPRPLR